MSKFNDSKPIWMRMRDRPDAVENYEGGVSFSVDHRM
jgi:hypothetical protein